MVLNAEKIKRIKEIVEKHHASLLMGTLGKMHLTNSQKRKLREEGVELENEDSALEALYHHNYLNRHGDPQAPKDEPEMRAQQRNRDLPGKTTHLASMEHLNSNMTHLIEKQKAEVLSRVEGIIREANNQFKFDKMRIEDLSKEKSISKLKTELRDYSRDANRNWDRITNTEVSNSISLGSVDRLVDENKNKDLGEVYVYRIVVNDAALCLAEKELIYLEDKSLIKVGDLKEGDIL